MTQTPMEIALVTLLSGDSPPAIPAPVFAMEAPADQAAPYVVYSVVSGEDWQDLDGADGLVQGRVQIDVYAARQEDMIVLARIVRRAMLDANAADPSATIQGVTLSNRSDFREGETDPKLHRRSLDFIVTYNEE